MKLSVVQVESNPQLVQIVPPNEVVVLISFEITIGDVRGMMNLCIPFNSIERIGGKLSANSWVTYGHRQATPEAVEQISRAVCTFASRVERPLVADANYHQRTFRPPRGRHHHHNQGRRQPALVSIEGIPKFHASPGAFKGHKAIRHHRRHQKPEALE